jgi:6-phosphogluconolactonase
VRERKAWAKAFYLTAQEMFRITITAPITNKSARVAFLASGEKKANTLKNVLEGEFQPDIYPSQLIKPVKGELHWFLDEDAAKLLS